MERRNRLVELYYYLQEPRLVARFQHRCGVHGTFSRTVSAASSSGGGGGTQALHNGALGHHASGADGCRNADPFGAGDGQQGHATTSSTSSSTTAPGARRRTVDASAATTSARGQGDERSSQNGTLVSEPAAAEPAEPAEPTEPGSGGRSPGPAAAGSSTLKPLRKNSLTGDAGQEFVIENRFLYYLFTFGTELGNELFYILFFPFVMWNVDVVVSRKLIVVWVWVMYLGQCTKDVVRWPRPASPPVVKVEMFYNSEYSMPSTHAMSGTAIPFALFCMTYCRWQYPFLLGLGLALCWCLVVCISRIYMGMHSVLDVMAGVLYSALILLLLLPALDWVDAYYLRGRHAPLVIVALHLAMGLFSFTLDTWSTSRADTAQILATGAGVALASHANHLLGLLPDPGPERLPLAMPALSAGLVGGAALRHAVGVLALMATRALMKAVTIPAVCWATGVPGADVRKARQNMRVELPYRYIVYGTMGFNVLFLVPLLFRCLRLA